MSIEDYIAEQRDAKATKVVRWLEKANTTDRVCRRCWLPITRDDGRWLTGDGSEDCGASGFKAAGLHVTHAPETWTPVRVANAPAELRRSIGEAAGLTRPCSPATWDRVVILFTPPVRGRPSRPAARTPVTCGNTSPTGSPTSTLTTRNPSSTRSDVAIYTCSYTEYKQQDQPDRVPVRASRGYPRFKLPYADRMAYLGEVTPEFAWLKVPYERYLELFLARLEGHGPKKIGDRLAEISRNAGGRDPVLLCYEDLGNPANWCHRTLFADWWLTQTGEEVVELGRNYVEPTGATAADPTLFDDIADGS